MLIRFVVFVCTFRSIFISFFLSYFLLFFYSFICLVSQSTRLRVLCYVLFGLVVSYLCLVLLILFPTFLFDFVLFEAFLSLIYFFPPTEFFFSRLSSTRLRFPSTACCFVSFLLVAPRLILFLSFLSNLVTCTWLISCHIVSIFLYRVSVPPASSPHADLVCRINYRSPEQGKKSNLTF